MRPDTFHAARISQLTANMKMDQNCLQKHVKLICSAKGKMNVTRPTHTTTLQKATEQIQDLLHA